MRYDSMRLVSSAVSTPVFQNECLKNEGEPTSDLPSREERSEPAPASRDKPSEYPHPRVLIVLQLFQVIRCYHCDSLQYKGLRMVQISRTKTLIPTS